MLAPQEDDHYESLPAPISPRPIDIYIKTFTHTQGNIFKIIKAKVVRERFGMVYCGPSSIV
jgi:hypothetical protein